MCFNWCVTVFCIGVWSYVTCENALARARTSVERAGWLARFLEPGWSTSPLFLHAVITVTVVRKAK